LLNGEKKPTSTTKTTTKTTTKARQFDSGIKSPLDLRCNCFHTGNILI
jgi:hypothetical protein